VKAKAQHQQKPHTANDQTVAHCAILLSLTQRLGDSSPGSPPPPSTLVSISEETTGTNGRESIGKRGKKGEKDIKEGVFFFSFPLCEREEAEEKVACRQREWRSTIVLVAAAFHSLDPETQHEQRESS